MKILLNALFKTNTKQLLHLKKVNNIFVETLVSTTSLRFLNIGGKASNTLLLSPAEATKILRTNEQTVDLPAKCPIKYYDVNYLGANSPPEDRQAQAKFLNSDVYLFGVFDGHGGNFN